MKIIIDDLKGGAIQQFLEEHIEDMKSVSPPESKHALDLKGLQMPEITFWSIYDGNDLVGCAALKELTRDHGEIKSMRTSKNHRGLGIGSKLLEHLIRIAIDRRYDRLSLETGSMNFFQPARSLYRKFGFIECSPFDQYTEDPNSVFMTLALVKR